MSKSYQKQKSTKMGYSRQDIHYFYMKSELLRRFNIPQRIDPKELQQVEINIPLDWKTDPIHRILVNLASQDYSCTNVNFASSNKTSIKD